ncbi:MAG TPA: hypothetical protein VFQ38_22490 [Longimicrobiales bacterium]|nr:hypothetical protein [Longimicrobiales bacterium]
MPASTPRTRPARRLAALLALAVHVALLVLAPLAEAHEPTGGPVHVEAPGEHHAVHCPAGCPICSVMQLGAVPGRSLRVPAAAVAARVVAQTAEPSFHSQPCHSAQVARAPPVV